MHIPPIDPALAVRLQKSPDFKELSEFLTLATRELNRLDDITGTTAEEKAIELTSRQRALETIAAMLSPLLVTPANAINTSAGREYDVG